MFGFDTLRNGPKLLGLEVDERSRVNLQVFYYPQDVPREMGPTEILPGSHFLYSIETRSTTRRCFAGYAANPRSSASLAGRVGRWRIPMGTALQAAPTVSQPDWTGSAYLSRRQARLQRREYCSQSQHASG